MCPQHIDDTKALGGSAGVPQGRRAQTLCFQSWKDPTGGSPKRGAETRRRTRGLRLQRSVADSHRSGCGCHRPTGREPEASVCVQGPVCSHAPVGPSLTAVNIGFSSPSNSPAKPNSRLQTTTWGTVCHTQAATAELTRV